MISVEEARSRILAAFSPLPPELVALPDALGRVTAEDIGARVTQPPAAMSAARKSLTTETPASRANARSSEVRTWARASARKR